MQIRENISLADYTAFGVGGPAKRLIAIDKVEDVLEAEIGEPYWVLGYGTNCVISDKGLPGSVLLMRDGGQPKLENDLVIADASTNWDAVVELSIEHGLWGLELMSGIPGNVGAAVMGNIAAYGQQLAHSFAWVELFDPATNSREKLGKEDIDFSYRASSLQSRRVPPIVLRVGLQLSRTSTHDLVYASALKIAEEMGKTPDTQQNRRAIILETRKRAGSIYDEKDPHHERTAGSFFKNPLVGKAKAEYLAGFDESGKTVEELLEQNRVHGGDEYRVSAAHILLATGFQRGQSWGPVRLHPKHVLKIENTGGATARQIYDVAHEIMATVKAKLGIDLEPEVRFLGDF